MYQKRITKETENFTSMTSFFAKEYTATLVTNADNGQDKKLKRRFINCF